LREAEVKEQKLSIVRSLLALVSNDKEEDLNISLTLNN